MLNTFTEDVVQRSNIARGARHRVGGSRSKKCPLSQDHMTKKQWEERNGEVYTYNLSKPMSWEKFVHIDKELQNEFLCGLIEKYNVNASSLAEMFDVSAGTVRGYIKRRNLNIQFHVGHRMTQEQKNAWDMFLHGGDGFDAMGGDQEHDEPMEVEEEPGAFLSELSFTFVGKINPAEIANTLLHTIGKDAVGKVKIDLSLERGNDNG